MEFKEDPNCEFGKITFKCILHGNTAFIQIENTAAQPIHKDSVVDNFTIEAYKSWRDDDGYDWSVYIEPKAKNHYISGFRYRIITEKQVTYSYVPPICTLHIYDIKTKTCPKKCDVMKQLTEYMIKPSCENDYFKYLPDLIHQVREFWHANY